MTLTIVRIIRAVAKSQHPAVRLAKRVVTTVLHRANVVAVARLSSGDVLYVDLANAVGRTIWLRGDYSAEESITRLIASTLRPGDVFFDVGANVGFFSLTASRMVGDGGEVHAFEPLPTLVTLLRKTVAANALTNVSVVEAAVGKTAGVISIAAMPDSAYSHLIEGAVELDRTHGGLRQISVASVTIDDYVRKAVGRLPRLIKMDIEGSEVEAIEGARVTLSDPQGPDLICEVGAQHLARFRHTPGELFGLLASMGYRATNPKSGKPMRVEDLSDAEYNVLFTKRAT